MKSGHHIHDLESLDKEILRLKKVASETAREFDEDVKYVRDNFFTLLWKSIKRQDKKEKNNSSYFRQFFNTEPVQEVVSDVTDRIAENASESFMKFLDRLTEKLRSKRAKE